MRLGNMSVMVADLWISIVFAPHIETGIRFRSCFRDVRTRKSAHPWTKSSLESCWLPLEYCIRIYLQEWGASTPKFNTIYFCDTAIIRQWKHLPDQIPNFLNNWQDNIEKYRPPALVQFKLLTTSSRSTIKSGCLPKLESLSSNVRNWEFSLLLRGGDKHDALEFQ